jgi:putative component of membrane protein insertase Oxa1/YidC/SpoIIIJ protein YidD
MRNIQLKIWPASRSAVRVGWHLPRKGFSLLITAYQHTLSPDHGPLKNLYPYGYCRHHPTCSEYSKQAVASRGVIIGISLSILRILSCNPWRKPDEQTLEKAVKKHLNMP